MSASAQSRPGRRELLAGAAALGLAGSVAGCGSSRSTSPTRATGPSTPSQTTAHPTTSAPTTTAGPPHWASLSHELDGALLRPGDASFTGMARLYDPRFDRLRPDAVVEAAGTADVAAALAFGRRYGLTVSPRAGGHSYVGASAGRGGIQIDTRRLDAVHYDAASQTVTVGAGAALLAVHTALEPVGRTVPTGTCASVGVAGLTLGGGLGVEDRTYGLTCDAAESFRLVTAAGQDLVASATQHADLFWACRGGGGGNLGVLIEVRYRTFPAHPMSFFSLRWSDQQAEAVIRGWQARVPTMPRSSWANLHLDAAAGSGLTPSIFGVSFAGGAESEADAFVAAVGASPVGRSTYARSHHDGVLLLAGCSGQTAAQCRLPPHGTLAREISVAGSDVIARPLNASQRSAVAHLLRERAAKGQSASAIVDPLGGAASVPSSTATAFAWRRALGTIQWYVGLSAVPSGATTRATYDWIDDAHRAVAGTSVGGYVNYLEPGRPLADYYGPNFDRLRAVRRRYDPDKLFHGAFVIPH